MFEVFFYLVVGLYHVFVQRVFGGGMVAMYMANVVSIVTCLLLLVVALCWSVMQVISSYIKISYLLGAICVVPIVEQVRHRNAQEHVVLCIITAFGAIFVVIVIGVEWICIQLFNDILATNRWDTNTWGCQTILEVLVFLPLHITYYATAIQLIDQYGSRVMRPIHLWVCRIVEVIFGSFRNNHPIATADVCVVCLENGPDVTLQPCGHKCLCYRCRSFIYETCPLCRSSLRHTDHVKDADHWRWGV